MRTLPALLLTTGLCLGLDMHHAQAAAFDGKWVADIPAQGRCNYTGTMTLVVAGHDLSGHAVNGGGGQGRFAGTIDDNGNGTFLANERDPGTITFTGEHFDATWNNGNCDRHASGDRAPDETQRAALAAARKQHQDAYAELVRRAEAGDKTVDYTVLRTESVYAQDWDFYDTKARGLLDQANAAAKGKDCPTAMAKLAQIIKLDFTMDSAHALKSDCLKQAGDHDKARIESDIANGLIHSLMDSTGGDHGLIQTLSGSGGSTEQNAYVVSSLREEMDVLANRHIQLKTRQTEIRGSNGRYYDLIHGVSITNGIGPRGGDTIDVSTKAVYFDITSFVTGRISHRAMVETVTAAIR
jgi:hypothetical protein